jgi:phosphate transport system ATP-binding protein
MKDEAQTSDSALAAAKAQNQLSRGGGLRFATDYLALQARNLNIVYGDRGRAVRDLDCSIPRKAVTAIIGPPGCGKSTLLRAFNRMNELIPGATTTGEVLFHSKNIYAPGVDPAEVRRRIGMVFQKPKHFPKSIYKNIAGDASADRYAGDYDALVESCLRTVDLWDEVKDKLKKSALALSGDQQLRLCIARSLALMPEVILMDEPTSALDPISTASIEELISELKHKFSIVIATDNIQQAGRISDMTAFMLLGELVEYAPTKRLFVQPEDERTERYITGRFG